MEIKYGSVFGNYKWEAIAEIDEKLVPVLCSLGALQLGQRTPSSAAEKEMDGYDKRPAKFERKSIPFSEEGAAILAKHLEGMKVEIGRDEKDAPIFATIEAAVTVEKYEGSTTDVVMKEEREAYARRTDDEGRKALAKLVDYSGELGDGTKENAPVEFIRAIRRYSQSIVKGL